MLDNKRRKMCSRNFAFNATAFRFISSGGYVFEKLRTCIDSFVFHSDGRVFIKRACLHSPEIFHFYNSERLLLRGIPEIESSMECRRSGVPTLAVLILSVD
jgi:hypothetical protein